HRNQLSNVVRLIIKFAFVFVIPFAIITIAFAGNIISILFGADYIAATLTLQILAINAIFYTVFLIFSTSLIAVNKPLTNTKITAFISVLNLALNIIFIPVYGIAGAAISTTASYFIGMLLTFRSLRKEVTIPIDLGAIAKAFAGGLLMLGIIFFTKSLQIFDTWLMIIISLIAGLVAYTLFILRTKGLGKDDLLFLLKLKIPIPKQAAKILLKLAS
ncbi:MAG: polysaccharide biosynthesis C-terminal domain-containing protein, partial [Candidatus Moranbacteria bacterium]|nr:polysaccharide biosynthesis C-terminal domain-containing protein [Candidatus Moranbacteria bacterium]